MAIFVKAGTFATTGGNSTETVSGLWGSTHQPKVLFLWATDRTAEGAWGAGVNFSVGFAAAAGGLGVRGRSVSLRQADNQASSSVTVLHDTKLLQAPKAVTKVEMLSAGFKLTFSGSPNNGERLHYLAIGGDEVAADVVAATVTSANAAGSTVDVLSAIPGFTPSMAFVLGSVSAGNERVVSVGALDDQGGQWAVGWSAEHAQADSDADRFCLADAVAAIRLSTGAEDARLAGAGFVPGGVRFTVADAPDPSRPVALSVLMVSGLQGRAQATAKPTGAAPATHTIAPGFAMKGALLATTGQTAAGSAASAGAALGAIDAGGAETVGAFALPDAQATIDASSYASSAFGLVVPVATTVNGAHDAAAVGPAAAPTGSSFDLTWNPNSAAAIQVFSFAFGGPGKQFAGEVEGRGEAGGLVWKSWLLVGDALGAGELALGVVGNLPLLEGDALAAGALDAAPLSISAVLLGEAAGDALVSGRLGGALAGDVAGAGDVFAVRVAPGFVLLGDAAGEGTLDAPPLVMRANWIGAAEGAGEVFAFLPVDLPTVPVRGADYLPGAVNYVRNPSLESPDVGLRDWSAGSGVTLARVTDDGWHDTACAEFGFPAANASLRFGLVATQQGLGITRPTRWVASARVKAPPSEVLRLYAQVVYDDATVADAPAFDFAGTGAWEWVRSTPVANDPAKTVNYLNAVVARSANPANAAIAVRVDAVQVEEDTGAGATTFVYGGYGPPYYEWDEAPDASMSVRHPIPLARKGIGRGGRVQVEATMFRATYQNVFLEDVSDGVVSAKVSMDTRRDVTWQLSARITKDLWDRLTPYEDWVAPWLKVTYPDGTVREGQLGLYLVLDSPRAIGEHQTTIDLDARDPLWLLGRQGFIGPVVIREDTDYGRIARTLLDTAVLTEDEPGDGEDGRARYDVPDSDRRTKRRREFPRDTPRLELVNKFLRGGSCTPLWSSKRGILTSQKRGRQRMKKRTPVATWVANVPAETYLDLPRRAQRLADVPSEIVGVIQATPKATDLANEILLVSDDPHGRIRVKGKVNNKRNPRSAMWGGGRKHVRKLRVPFVDDQATAREVARALAEELGSQLKLLTLNVLPDPATDFGRQSVYLAIWDGAGNEVAVGQYAVHAVEYGFTPKDAVMRVTVGRLDDVDGVLEDAVAVGTASTKIVSARAKRKRVEIENVGDVPVWLAVNAPAVANQGDALLPGDSAVYQIDDGRPDRPDRNQRRRANDPDQIFAVSQGGGLVAVTEVAKRDEAEREDERRRGDDPARRDADRRRRQRGED